MGLKGQKDLPRMWLGVGSSHITQEHLKGYVQACVSATITTESHAGPRLIFLSPTLPDSHTLL